MKQYNTYKPSGIEWLGEIPEHWEVKRVKDIFKQINDSSADLEEGTYVPLENIESFTGRLIKRTSNENGEMTTLFKEGDILLNKLRPYLAKVLLAEFDGGVSGEVIVYRINAKYSNKINCGYFFYRFLSQEFISKINSITDGVKMPRSNPNKIFALDIQCPSQSEQTAIANYLDTKTAAIDRKIELLTSKADKYKSLRRSLINETVCRGLNPNAPLKDSGIEWIGKIPENWEVKRVKEIFRNTGSGTTPPSGDQTYYDDNGFNWLQTGDLNDGFITETSKKISLKAVTEFSTLKKYPKNSLVIAMYGATIGKMGYLNIDTTTNQACCVLTNPIGNNSQYLFYQLLSMKQFIMSLSTGGGQPNINQDIVRFLKLCIPPLDEQIAITNYLDSKTTQIDTILTNISNQISKLTQLRKTLINDVVTGKIKVTKE